MIRCLAHGIAVMMCVLAILVGTVGRLGAAEQERKIKVLITTGGHGFVREDFFAMWDSFKGITWREGKMEKSATAFTPENLDACDIVVTYDLTQKITDEQKAALLAFLKRGGGFVGLHHSIASQQDWPDYGRIIGVRYFLKPTMREGREYPRSRPTVGVDMRIQVADPKHPITEGLSDFDIQDEGYADYIVDPKVHVLLTTDNPKNDKNVAWTREEGKARVVFITFGHDNKAYTNPNYKRLVERAVLWAAAGSKGERQNANSP